MNPSPFTLVCFAVKEEAGPFREQEHPPSRARILLTGIGRRRAEHAIRQALDAEKPGLVLTCGFAGGLRPDLATGAVLFDACGRPELAARLNAAGGQPGRFHCAERVASSANEKEALRASTGADAVEMESLFIATVCHERNVPCAIVRVVLDTAGENLPLDFNALMGAHQKMNYGKLAIAVVKAPSKIGALLRLRKQSRTAAEKLAEVLGAVLRET
jgi:adenosylhomocysteine nucleosidase